MVLRSLEFLVIQSVQCTEDTFPFRLPLSANLFRSDHVGSFFLLYFPVSAPPV